LVFINYIGEALIVDVGGDLYTVPANGRLQVNLPPGEVGYSASAGFSGTNGIAQVMAGRYTGLGFTREIPPEEPDYEAGEPAPTPVPLEMSVFAVSLEGEPASGVPSAAVATAMPLAAESDDTPVPAATGQGVIGVTNYIGETLTFTIDNQTHSVAGGGGTLTINLTPGEYNFTASTPHAGANGSLKVAEGTTIQVSVVLDLQSGQMNFYVERETP
jgi:hypothetical protein